MRAVLAGVEFLSEEGCLLFLGVMIPLFVAADVACVPRVTLTDSMVSHRSLEVRLDL